MAIYRKMVTRPIPSGAVIEDGVASWRGRDGKIRRGEVIDVAGEKRIRTKSKTWYVRITLANGGVREFSTGHTDKQLAAEVQAQQIRRQREVKSGLISAADAKAADHASDSVAALAAGYVKDLASRPGKGGKKRTSELHVRNVERALAAGIEACRFLRVADLDRDKITGWLTNLAAGEKFSPRSCNMRAAAWSAFGNWLVDSGFVPANPFVRLRKASEAGKKRKRRSLKLDELRSLLTAARMRPVAEHGRPTEKLQRDPNASKRSRATWRKAPVTAENLESCYAAGIEKLQGKPDLLSRLQREGRERELIYRVLVTTGLRVGELTKLTIGDLHLQDDPPEFSLPAEFTKNGEPLRLPMRPDVAAAVAAWVAEERAGMAATDPVLVVPDGLLRIMGRDMAAAGIAKIDDRGRRLDVHSLRVTFCSMLHANDVAGRKIMALMRHSTMALTEATYTDESVLPLAESVSKLPEITVAPCVALTGSEKTGFSDASDHQTNRATEHRKTLQPAENPEKTGAFGSSGDRTRTGDPRLMNLRKRVLSPCDDTVSVAGSDGCTVGCTDETVSDDAAFAHWATIGEVARLLAITPMPAETRAAAMRHATRQILAGDSKTGVAGAGEIVSEAQEGV